MRVGADETLSLLDPNTFPLNLGLHVVQIHCHLIQHSRLHAAPLPLRGKDENIQLLAGEVGVRACDNQAGCLDLIRPLAGCPSISLAPSIPVPPCPQRQEDKGSCPSPGRAEKGPWGHRLFPFYLGTPGNGKWTCPEGLCTGMSGVTCDGVTCHTWTCLYHEVKESPCLSSPHHPLLFHPLYSPLPSLPPLSSFFLPSPPLSS